MSDLLIKLFGNLVRESEVDDFNPLSEAVIR